ncbi:DUF2313 domain-containing protein [Clostridiaceae bacterium M8S5]|nr:DUF2313 domain-containing protein [Clostridiaceae bacterium M8S5]
MNKLLQYLPSYYKTSKVATSLTDSQYEEIKELSYRIRKALEQLAIDTADYTLDRWEKEYGLTINKYKTVEQRRSAIKGKLIGQGTFTKTKALELANAYSKDGLAEYVNTEHEYEFKTRHSVDDLTSLKNMIASFEEFKPAHIKHIVGLFVEKEIGPKVDELLLTVQFEVDMTKEDDHKFIYHLAGTMLGYSEFNPDTIAERYTSGAGLMNGTKTLDGENKDGMYYYIPHANVIEDTAMQKYDIKSKLHYKKETNMRYNFSYDIGLNYEVADDINYRYDVKEFAERNQMYKVIKQIHFTDIILEHEKSEKLRYTKPQNMNIIHDKNEELNVNLEVLGISEFSPDKISIDYTDGALNLEGLKTLNGKNPQEADYYARNSEELSIKKYVDKKLKEIDIIRR